MLKVLILFNLGNYEAKVEEIATDDKVNYSFRSRPVLVMWRGKQEPTRSDTPRHPQEAMRHCRPNRECLPFMNNVRNIS